MARFRALLAKELRLNFASPRTYLVVALFALASGLLCFDHLHVYNQLLFLHASSTLGGFDLGTLPDALNLRLRVFLPLMDNLALAMVALLPLLTMRVFAEENAEGTDTLLAMTGAGPVRILAAKFLATAVLISLAVAMAFLYPALSVGGVGYGLGQLSGAFLGLGLHGLALGGIGLAASAMTRSQVVAAVLAWAAGLALWDLSWLAALWPGEPVFTRLLSSQEHFTGFADGFVSLSDLFYFAAVVSVCALMARVALAVRRVTG